MSTDRKRTGIAVAAAHAKGAATSRESTNAKPPSSTQLVIDIAGEKPMNSTADDPFEKMTRMIQAQFLTTNNNITSISESVSGLNERVSSNSSHLEELKKTVVNNAERNKTELSSLYGVIAEKDKARQDAIEELKGAVKSLTNKSTISETVTRTIQAEVAKEVDRKRAISGASSLRPSYAQAAGPTPMAGTLPEMKTDRENKYWIARRSLRLWPIEGSSSSEVMQGFGNFIADCLLIPTGTVIEADIEYVRKMRNGGKFSRIKDELLVVFKSVEVRDTVASYARNLADKIDANGHPTAGVRLEIPESLHGVHQDLKKYGAVLRQQHGAGFKRSIKFDDTSLSFYMNILLPNTSDWMRVDWELAREERLGRQKLEAISTRQRLLSSISSTDETSGTTSPAPPMSPPASASRSPPTSATLLKHNRHRPRWGENV